MKESRRVVGVDEVGRGGLAGPVVAAAVILPSETYSWMDEIRDSKKLAVKKRIQLANFIAENCQWSIQESSPHQVDEMNILQATLSAMKAAVKGLYYRLDVSQRPGIVLIDGPHIIPNFDLPIPQKALVDGDNLHRAIGAASILAKVYRDNCMIIMDSLYPEYGFCRNMGYGTAEHLAALAKYGPCPIHRKTFGGVKEHVQSGKEAF